MEEKKRLVRTGADVIKNGRKEGFILTKSPVRYTDGKFMPQSDENALKLGYQNGGLNSNTTSNANTN